MKGRRWPLKVALLVGSLAVALVGVNMWLESRLPPTGHGFLIPPSDGMEVPWVLTPDTTAQYHGSGNARIPATDVRISSQGLRADREYPVPKAGSVVRILVLGDSFVFGSGVNIEDTLVSRWQQRLGERYEVVNMGVPGYATSHAVELLEDRGLKLDPSAVVILLTDNDRWLDGRYRALEQQEESALERFTKNLFAAEGKERSGDPENHPEILARFRTAIARLSALCTKHEIPCRVVPIFPPPFEEVLAEYGILHDFLMDDHYRSNHEHYTIPNDGHPTAEGHEYLADRLDARLGAWARALTK